MDPGTTTGIALVSPFLDYIEVTSRKGVTKQDLAYYIISQGDPVLVATDKKKVPGFVQKIASTFGCRINKLDHDLTQQEKKKFVDEINIDVEDRHQLDALASALFAVSKMRSLINKIEEGCKKSGTDKRDVLDIIINKKAPNIEMAINMLAQKQSEKKPKKISINGVGKKIEFTPTERYRLLQAELKKQERTNRILKEYIESLQQKINELRKEKKGLAKRREQRKNNIVINLESQVRSQKLEINELRRKLASAEQRAELLKSHEEVIFLKNLSKKRLSIKRLRGKIVFVEHMEGDIQKLEQKEPAIVLTPDDVKANIFLINADKKLLKEHENEYFIEKRALEKLRQKNLKTGFERMLRGYRERRKENRK